MGGFGSGSKGRWDAMPTTESQKRIDIRWLKQTGCLMPGTIGHLSWSYGGEPSGDIMYKMKDDTMTLNYNYRWNDGELEPVEQTIHFDRTPCHFGGFRKWFLCSGCGRRVAVLYGRGKLFLCRHCYGLAYGSQQETEVDRMLRKCRKIRDRLGASTNMTEPIWEKPKGMHRRTFDRLRMEADAANAHAWGIMGHRFGVVGQGHRDLVQGTNSGRGLRKPTNNDGV